MSKSSKSVLPLTVLAPDRRDEHGSDGTGIGRIGLPVAWLRALLGRLYTIIRILGESWPPFAPTEIV